MAKNILYFILLFSDCNNTSSLHVNINDTNKKQYSCKHLSSTKWKKICVNYIIDYNAVIISFIFHYIPSFYISLSCYLSIYKHFFCFYYLLIYSHYSLINHFMYLVCITLLIESAPCTLSLLQVFVIIICIRFYIILNYHLFGGETSQLTYYKLYMK